MVGALIPTAVVLAITVAVAALGVRREWDVDNVSVPVVTAAGDIVTLPSLFLATYLVIDVPGALRRRARRALRRRRHRWRWCSRVRSHLDVLRRIVRESLPFLARRRGS